MISYRFSIVKKGIVVAWPWLFQIFLFRELTSLVIYPFIFVQVKDDDVTSKFNLRGMMNLIFIKQQEEILQILILIIIPLFFIIGWYSLFALLIPVILLMIMFLFIYDKHKKSYIYYTKSSIILDMITELPMFDEAYHNCNYPDYFKVRRVFEWRKYLYY